MNQFIENIKRGQGAQAMNEQSTQLFAQVLLSEMGGAETPDPDEIPEGERSFLMNVALKRINVAKLPIKFSLPGIVAAEALAAGNVGSMVTILIDCLSVYENETVTAEKLANLYPMGFYNEETFTDYIDNHLKPRKVKWAEIY